MANKLRFSPTVPEELRGAIDSYEVVSVQLGNRIRRAFHELFQMIKENPELYAIVYDNIRIARVRPFPFLVHYRVTQTGPDVLSIFPSAGDPNEWKRITRNR
ncbi:MAG: type II toxin-antitoxin system RelE/ParE family toxin [Planctomycetota bacterium]